MENLSNEKYEKIVVQKLSSGSVSDKEKAMRKFVNDLSKMGDSVSSVELIDGDNCILRAIRNYCKNVTKMELSGGAESLSLHNFPKLKELILFGKKQSVEKLKNIFVSVPELESLACWYDEHIMRLLVMLPKLKSLWIYDMPYETGVFQHVHRFDGLTKLNIGCRENCIGFLKSFEKLNLVELTLHMPYDGDTFEIIKLFLNLEVLCMDHWKGMQTLPTSALIDLPSKLRRIQLNGVKISYKTFLSLVQDLDLLEEFDVGRGDIFWNLDESIGLCDSNFIYLIANGLGLELTERTLKIIYTRYYKTMEKLPYKDVFDSSHLKIINKYYALHQPKSQQIYI